MEFASGFENDNSSEQRTATFHGTVWINCVLATGEVIINDVFFEPSARTYWHSHGTGQALLISGGHGVVATRSGEIRALREGDVVYAPAGEVHWHGAVAHALMRHRSVSLGATTWLEPVADAEYRAALEVVRRAQVGSYAAPARLAWSDEEGRQGRDGQK